MEAKDIGAAIGAVCGTLSDKFRIHLRSGDVYTAFFVFGEDKNILTESNLWKIILVCNFENWVTTHNPLYTNIVSGSNIMAILPFTTGG